MTERKILHHDVEIFHIRGQTRGFIFIVHGCVEKLKSEASAGGNCRDFSGLRQVQLPQGLEPRRESMVPSPESWLQTFSLLARAQLVLRARLAAQVPAWAEASVFIRVMTLSFPARLFVTFTDGESS